MTKLHIIFILLFLFTSSLVHAKDEDNRYLLSKKTYDLLNLAREEMEDDKYASAIQKLNAHINKENIKPYDVAVINQTLGYAYNAQENYKLSIKSFVNAVSAKALPDKVAHDLIYIIAQLNIHLEKYTEGLDYLEQWFDKETTPSSEAHLLIASAYYQINQFKKLIPHAKSAIEKSDMPQQSWYELLIAGYYETKMYRDAASLLEIMINKYPDNNSYWLQLAAVYQQNKQEKKALAISELAYEKGILKGNGIIQLAQTYLYQQLPFKAAEVLNSSFDDGKIEYSKANVELLSNSWLLAHEKEKAATLLERHTPKFNDPSLYFKLGHIYVELEDWDKAGNALESVVTHSEIDDQNDIQATAWLLLGISSYHEKDMSRSTKALNKALGFKDTKDQAAWWLKQVEEVLIKKQNNQT